jgi:hypothetical protein
VIFLNFAQKKICVVDCDFYWGYSSFCGVCGWQIVVSCGGMCGKRGVLNAAFPASKNGTGFSTLFLGRSTLRR